MVTLIFRQIPHIAGVRFLSASQTSGRPVHLLLNKYPWTLPSYEDVYSQQKAASEAILNWKKDPEASEPPFPSLIAFTPRPVFTLGRRQKLESISPVELARLKQPLIVDKSMSGMLNDTDGNVGLETSIITTERGGLMTYHGPGQIVLWPTIDLRSPLHHKFTVREYARILEETTQECLLENCGIETVLDHEAGVWVPAAGDRPMKKIAALGVHLRRHVTGFGTAVNLNIETEGGEERNPWGRFVPCGVETRGVTSVKRVMGEGWKEDLLQSFAHKWAEGFAKKIGIDDVEEREFEV